MTSLATLINTLFPGFRSRTKYSAEQPLYLGDLKTVVCGDNRDQVHIYFGGRHVSWLALPKQDAVQFAKTILHQAGAEDVTVRF